MANGIWSQAVLFHIACLTAREGWDCQGSGEIILGVVTQRD